MTVDKEWYKSTVRKAGLQLSVVSAIINNESRFKPFSTEGITVAWNQNLFDRFVIKSGESLSAIAASNPLLAAFAAESTSSRLNPKMINQAAKTVQSKIGDLKNLASASVKTGFNGSQAKNWSEILSNAGSVTGGTAHALRATAFGLGQILGNNHKILGYDSPLAMYNASWDPKVQVQQIITFLSQPAILPVLKTNKVNGFDLSSFDRAAAEKLASYYAGTAWRSYYPEYASNLLRFHEKYSAAGYHN